MSSFDYTTTYRWRIDAFAQRYKAAIKGDNWTSELLTFAEDEHERVVFYVKFYPLGLRAIENRTSALFIKIAELCSDETLAPIDCEAWLETENATRSETKRAFDFLCILFTSFWRI